MEGVVGFVYLTEAVNFGCMILISINLTCDQLFQVFQESNEIPPHFAPAGTIVSLTGTFNISHLPVYQALVQPTI